MKHGSKEHSFARSLGFLALALTALAGCGNDGAEESGDLAQLPAEESPAPPPDVNASFDDMEGSGVSGMAHLVRSEGGIDVEVTLEGVTEGQKYLAKIHRGGCGDEGEEVASIGHLMVTGTTAATTERVDLAALAPGMPYSVVIRLADQTPVACTDLDLMPLERSAR